MERKTMDEILKKLKRINELLECISDNQDQINSSLEELQDVGLNDLVLEMNEFAKQTQ